MSWLSYGWNEKDVDWLEPLVRESLAAKPTAASALYRNRLQAQGAPQSYLSWLGQQDDDLLGRYVGWQAENDDRYDVGFYEYLSGLGNQPYQTWRNLSPQERGQKPGVYAPTSRWIW